MSVSRLLVAAGLAAASLALAQSPAPAPTPAASDAKPACVKPDSHPGRLASDSRKKQWFKEANAWKDCMKANIAKLEAQANAAVAATNEAINDFNATSKEFQAQIDAAADK